MSKKKQIAEPAGAVDLVAQEQKSSKKKRKAESVQATQEGNDPAELAKSLSETAVKETEEAAVKPKKKKSKKAAAASEAAGSLPPPPVVVPAVMLSPDVVILPAASLQAAASSQADANGAAEGAVPGSASGRGSTGARAFKRVNDEEWLGKKGAWDNSYEAKFGNSGYGAKASQTLLQVRGKDFRHEKTKKKRGSYKGGIIDNNVNSFKFESDDE
ncbi:hypothetical protein WJX82_004649 [Trebouxia sp. C0006]